MTSNSKKMEYYANKYGQRLLDILQIRIENNKSISIETAHSVGVNISSRTLGRIEEVVEQYIKESNEKKESKMTPSERYEHFLKKYGKSLLGIIVINISLFQDDRDVLEQIKQTSSRPIKISDIKAIRKQLFYIRDELEIYTSNIYSKQWGFMYDYHKERIDNFIKLFGKKAVSHIIIMGLIYTPNQIKSKMDGYFGKGKISLNAIKQIILSSNFQQINSPVSLHKNENDNNVGYLTDLANINNWVFVDGLSEIKVTYNILKTALSQLELAEKKIQL